MEKYIKPEIQVIDLKAMRLLDDTYGVPIGASRSIGQGHENISEESGGMSKGSIFDWEGNNNSPWDE